MASGSSARRSKPIALCVLSTMSVVASTARSEDYCTSETCKEVARAYEKSVNAGINPCSDFFTHVCSGWLKKVSNRNFLTETPLWIQTQGRTESAADIILIKELDRLFKRSLTERLRDSELQAAYFYRSCTRSVTNPDWDLNIRTLRKWFNEVDLPFFDEVRNTEPVSGERPTPLSTLMKLTLQFGISPIFEILYRFPYFTIQKSGGSSSENITEFPEIIAAGWKTQLLERSKNTSGDTSIHFILASAFEASRIFINASSIMRIGRNAAAVNWMLTKSFKHPTVQYEKLAFSFYTLIGVPYYELFTNNAGNMMRFRQEAYGVKAVPQFFQSLMITLTDPDLTQIFDDFIGFWILRSQLKQMNIKSRCNYDRSGGFCQPFADARGQREIFCGLKVGFIRYEMISILRENFKTSRNLLS